MRGLAGQSSHAAKLCVSSLTMMMKMQWRGSDAFACQGCRGDEESELLCQAWGVAGKGQQLLTEAEVPPDAVGESRARADRGFESGCSEWVWVLYWRAAGLPQVPQASAAGVSTGFCSARASQPDGDCLRAGILTSHVAASFRLQWAKSAETALQQRRGLAGGHGVPVPHHSAAYLCRWTRDAGGRKVTDNTFIQAGDEM